MLFCCCCLLLFVVILFFFSSYFFFFRFNTCTHAHVNEGMFVVVGILFF